MNYQDTKCLNQIIIHDDIMSEEWARVLNGEVTEHNSKSENVDNTTQSLPLCDRLDSLDIRLSKIEKNTSLIPRIYEMLKKQHMDLQKINRKLERYQK